MPRFSPRRTLALLALPALLAACGRDRPAERAAPPPPAPPAAGEVPSTGGRVYEVRLRPGGAAGAFDPALVTARRGDVIRFVLDGGGEPRGVSFPTEGNPAGAPLPAPSPLMRQPGQVYEVPVDLPPGTYTFVPLPPAPSAKSGTLTVVE